MIAPLADALLYRETGDAVLGGAALLRHGAGHGRAADHASASLRFRAAEGRAVDGGRQKAFGIVLLALAVDVSPVVPAVVPYARWARCWCSQASSSCARPAAA